MFHVFLRQFLVVYKNWEPVSQGQFSEAASTPIQPQEFISCSDNVVVGCSAGHPAEVISTLTQEIATLTSLITECKLYLYVLNIRLFQISLKRLCLSKYSLLNWIIKKISSFLVHVFGPSCNFSDKFLITT